MTDTLTKPTYAELESEIERLTALLTPKRRPLSEEVFMSVSSQATKMALEYQRAIEDEENPREASERLGLTVRELGLRRTRLHNKLMSQLEQEGLDFSQRSEVTNWTQKFCKWVRSED